MMTLTIQEKEAMYLEIVSDNRQLISKVCYMYACAPHAPWQDLYQEVLANIWQGLESYRGESKLSTWLYRTAINTCVTYHRRFSRQTDRTTSLEDLPGVNLPADTTDKSSLLEQMYHLISALSDIDKAIIMMWLDEHSYDDIAEVTGFTRNNVATRLRRIKQRLIDNSNR